MTHDAMRQATQRAKERFRRMVERRPELAAAQQPNARRPQECPACTHDERIGGAAMTTRACMCCGKSQLFGNTNTDVLCPECAKTHDLCKHCGGDIAMNVERTAWPDECVIDEGDPA